ncbi:synaptic vesicle glycoprotein 2C-like [Frankliniella occidentalis]|uniref:Synaptic vesicle glycoprotein 2C-like n=1 Tax=Frankliniella occidentalis TaxID=133901 RepID=A0A6J1TFR8_FRAOC|nr:synaptic vesicle glycoprotein 2C-like [Frankliniella occidentalis]
MAPRAHPDGEHVAQDPAHCPALAEIRKRLDPERGGKDATAKDEAADFEAAVDATGSGLFGYAVLLTAGLIFLTCGLQNGINAYILPAARCDFDLTSAQMGALNAFFLAGGMVSSYVWGVLGDALGRRPVIVFALLADAAGTLCSTLSQSYASFAFFRFLSGFLIGGPASITFLYMGEFVPARARATYSQIVGGFWTVSWILLPGVAWLVLPQPWQLRALGVTFNSWRVMLSLITAPTLLCAFLAMRLPETPKFLISQGRLKEAMDVLRNIYAINTGRDADDYPVRRLALPAQDAAVDVVELDAAPELNFKSVLSVARRMAREALTLFRPPVVGRTALVCAIMCANMFSYYGLVLWLPELFNRFDTHYSLHPNKTMTVCQLSRSWAEELKELELLKADNISSSSAVGPALLFEPATAVDMVAGPKCNAAEAVNESVFIKTLIISAVCLVANVVTAPFATRVGRRALPFLLNVASGVLAAGIYFVDSTTGNLVVASLFQALIGTANTAVNSFMVDIFPARVSALGVCSALLAGRVGAAVSNLVLGSLLDISCEVPIFLISGTVILGGLLCVFVQPAWTDGAPEPDRGDHSLRSAFTVVSELDAQPKQSKAAVDLHVGVEESSALPA